MLTELPGLVLSRTIPQHCLLGVMSGAYQVCGGVIRNGSGQIVAHLVNAGSGLLSGGVLPAVGEFVNSVQLYQLGQKMASLEAATAQLVSLVQGTAVLSGLTLAVSVGGFAFLSHRLGKLDKTLMELAKDVKAIHTLLHSQERAALNNALQTLAQLDPGQDEKVRIPILVNTRQTIGTIHQRYREQLEAAGTLEEVLAVEEYYSVTALGHALCTAELGMQQVAADELERAYQLWLSEIRRIGKDLILANPERFLGAGYGGVKTAELVDWLDFAHASAHGIGWVDVLREQSAGFRLPRFGSNGPDKLGIELIRKFHARDRVLQGSVAQHHYLAQHALLPSQHQRLIASLSRDKEVGGCLVLVAPGEPGPSGVKVA